MQIYKFRYRQKWKMYGGEPKKYSKIKPIEVECLEEYYIGDKYFLCENPENSPINIEYRYKDNLYSVYWEIYDASDEEKELFYKLRKINKLKDND